MTTRSMSKQTNYPQTEVITIQFIKKGLDDIKNPTKIAGITIPTSDVGWHMRLNQIAKFIETHHKNAMNGEHIKNLTDISLLQTYTNFLAVSKRHWLFTDDHYSNSYRAIELLKKIQSLNKLM